MSQGINLQLWDASTLVEKAKNLPEKIINTKEPRDYQEKAIVSIVQPFLSEYENRSLIVLATGLGKTFVAAEAFRRINALRKIRILVLAHANPLVYQLERSFWPFLFPSQQTTVWNGIT